jgi:hypothetical protein
MGVPENNRPTMTVASILWTRLDTPGHDACRLLEKPGGWELEGTAVFVKGGTAARLDYNVACDASWRTQWGRVRGWIGARALDLYIAPTESGSWTMNGDEVLRAMDCVDLDLGFTPATNLIALRRLGLVVGQRAATPTAWLDDDAFVRVERLEQIYQRQNGGAYAYESPRFEYKAVLDVDAAGFVRRYPTLWEAVTKE